MILRKFKRIFLYGMALFLRPFLPIKKGQVVFWSHVCTQYSCNPKYLSEYLQNHHSDFFTIFWLLDKRVKMPKLNGACFIPFPSFKAMIILNTSEFIVTNWLTTPYSFCWKKGKKQKFIMTWHANMSLKKIEGDITQRLTTEYIKGIKRDSSFVNLFLSGSQFTTDQIRRAFFYDGEILDKGYPRDDILFNSKLHKSIRQKVLSYYGIDEHDKVILYAPTFRDDYSLKYYNIEWENVTSAFYEKSGKKVSVLIRLHPNFYGKDIDMSSLFDKNYLYDATMYDDIQELIISSDVLITDYSSCMFDFALLRRPCFGYAIDVNEYNRGFYFELEELPFPFSRTNNELVKKILDFNEAEYLVKLDLFIKESWGSCEMGKASSSVAKWMIRNSN